MKLRIGRLKYVFLTFIFVFSLVSIRRVLIHRNKVGFNIMDRYQATARGGWFRNSSERLRTGSADTWRSDTDMSSTPEVLDPIANRTFLLMKTGASVLWDRIPIHLETTFKRYPHHQIYADIDTRIGNETVIDIIKTLPHGLLYNPQLKSYRFQRQQLAENWGWGNEDLEQEKTDGWNTDKFKNVPMLLHAYRSAPKTTDWFLFLDDDSYMHSQSLGSLLRQLDPSEKHYIGSFARLPDIPVRREKIRNKHILDLMNEDNELTVNFAHGGSGIILSRGAVESLFSDRNLQDSLVAEYSRQCLQLCCGDALLGFMLLNEIDVKVNDKIELKDKYIDAFQAETISSTVIFVAQRGWCARLASWHHLESWEIQSLYDWETSLQSRKRTFGYGILYSDFYHDFILPYALPERKDWDNLASTESFFYETPFYEKTGVTGENEKSNDFYPAHSIENCKKACKLRPNCFGWKYEHEGVSGTTCFLQNGEICRGIAKSPFKNGIDSDYSVVSGTMIDRIRAFRNIEVCDALYNREGQEDIAEEEQEGWYFRKLTTEQNEVFPLN